MGTRKFLCQVAIGTQRNFPIARCFGDRNSMRVEREVFGRWFGRWFGETELPLDEIVREDDHPESLSRNLLRNAQF